MRTDAQIVADAEAQADYDVVRDLVGEALRTALGGLLDAPPTEAMRDGVSRAVGDLVGWWLVQAPPAQGVPGDGAVEVLVWVEGLLQGVREALATAGYLARYPVLGLGTTRAHGSTTEGPPLKAVKRRRRRTPRG
jgi:hypothetical protein